MNIEKQHECAQTIDAFLDGTGGPYDWDDFISIENNDTSIQAIKDYCADSSFLYPPDKPNHWCNNKGIEKLTELSNLLKNEAEANIINFIKAEMEKA